MVKYILLGIIQGLTEFFPVSSSAHLVIGQKLLGINGEEIALAVILHLGTILALFVFFFKDIIAALRNLRLCVLIIVVTLITGIIGIVGKDFFKEIFSSVKLAACALAVTGIILILTRKFMEGKRDSLNIKDALILGLTQGVAIIPGISRSGITVSTLLFRRINRQEAFRFSFLAAIPAVLGAALMEAKEITSVLNINFFNQAAGFIFSFISGIFSLWALKIALSKAKLYYFGYYCIIIAVVVLLFMA